MNYKNPKSKRENPFRSLYDAADFNNVLQQKDKLPVFPYLVDVELTNHCNLKCVFCGQQTMMREKGFMSEETFKKVIDECSQYNTPVRLIRWGEPFLHKKIVDFCRYVKSRNLLLHITNNGLVIKEDDMRALIDLEVDSLIFSFQGATKEQYEIMRNNKQYDKLKANILKLVEMRGDKPKPFIHISNTVTNESEEEVHAFTEYWSNIVDSIGIGRTNLSLISSIKHNSINAQEKLNSLIQQETIDKQYKPCREVYQKLSINWDGKVSCCCRDYDDFLIVGDLNKDTLSDIWSKSRELKLFRELLDKMMLKSLTLCSTCYQAY